MCEVFSLLKSYLTRFFYFILMVISFFITIQYTKMRLAFLTSKHREKIYEQFIQPLNSSRRKWIWFNIIPLFFFLGKNPDFLTLPNIIEIYKILNAKKRYLTIWIPERIEEKNQHLKLQNNKRMPKYYKFTKALLKFS